MEKENKQNHDGDLRSRPGSQVLFWLGSGLTAVAAAMIALLTAHQSLPLHYGAVPLEQYQSDNMELGEELRDHHKIMTDLNTSINVLETKLEQIRKEMNSFEKELKEIGLDMRVVKGKLLIYRQQMGEEHQNRSVIPW